MWKALLFPLLACWRPLSQAGRDGRRRGLLQGPVYYQQINIYLHMQRREDLKLNPNSLLVEISSNKSNDSNGSNIHSLRGGPMVGKMSLVVGEKMFVEI